MRELRALVLLLAILALAPGRALAGSRSDEEESPRIVVGSKNFSESHLLGEILARYLRDRGYEVEHKAGLGGTLVCFGALRTGELDMYVEYTGTAWAIVLEEPERVVDPLRVYLHVEERYRALYDLEWLPPLGFANSYAIAVRESQAAELGLETVSDLVAHQGDLRAGFSIEFMNREDGYPGLAAHYGLDLGQVKGMEHSLAYDAIEGGAIDVMDVYTTDGKLARYDLRLLEDDRGFFPPYDAAPLVRRDLLERHPELTRELGRLAFRLPAERMIELNHAVEVENRAFDQVADGFLAEEGLLGDPSSVGADGEGTGDEGFGAFLLARSGETLRLAVQHVQLTGIAVLLATLIAIPLGIAITQNRTAERLMLSLAGIVQTIPSLALLAFLVAVPGFGLSITSAIAALFVYSVLPILRNTFTGISGVAPELIDAARGMGLTRSQILLRIQLPLATRTILAGIRTATVIGVGVATLAAFIGAGGLGEPIVTGLYLNDTRLVLAGALPAALLALLADALLGGVERLVTPVGLRKG